MLKILIVQRSMAATSFLWSSVFFISCWDKMYVCICKAHVLPINLLIAFELGMKYTEEGVLTRSYLKNVSLVQQKQYTFAFVSCRFVNHLSRYWQTCWKYASIVEVTFTNLKKKLMLQQKLLPSFIHANNNKSNGNYYSLQHGLN